MRSFNKSLEGRALIASVKIFGDICFALFLIFIFGTKKITIDFFAKTIAVIAVLQILIGWGDFAMGYPIKDTLFYAYKTARPNGFCHEPKALGRLTFCVFLFFFSLYMGKNKVIFQNPFITILLGIGMLFTFSASTIGASIVTLSFLFLLDFKLRSIPRLMIIVLIFSIAGFSMSQNKLFKEITYDKLLKITKGLASDQLSGEPFIFTSFEQGDRVALNVFYNKPEYIFFGTGPHLISIPGSRYTSKWMTDAYGKAFSLLPRVGILYIGSRSGLVGLFIYMYIYILLRKRILQSNKKYLLILLNGIYIFTNIIFTIWFYIYLAIIYAQVFFNDKKETTLT